MRGAVSLASPTENRIRPDKLRLPGEDRAMLRAAQPGFDIAAGLRGDRGGAGLDPRHVHPQLPLEGKAVLGAAPRCVCGIGAGDQRFGRYAAGVDASAAEQLTLDDRNRHAHRCKPSGQRRSGLPGANDDRVEAMAHRKQPKRAAMAFLVLMPARLR
jgi:hypothetical protein